MPLNTGGFSTAGSGVSDIFAGFGAGSKARGDLLEQQNYNLASQYALKEAAYTKMSTAIQEQQESREISKALGQTQADVAGAGFAESGSALDLLREGAQQGALQKQVTGYQGLITEEGYKEQAQSYQNMATAAGDAANAEKAAQTGDFITGGIKIAVGVASLAAGVPLPDVPIAPAGAFSGGLT